MAIICVPFLLYEPSSGRNVITGSAIGAFVFVVLASQIQYKPIKLKMIWGVIFTAQLIAGVILVTKPETQGLDRSWANVLFLAPVGLLLVLMLDRVSIWLHKDHFTMLSRGGMEVEITGRRRYRATDIFFSVLCFTLPFPLSEWLAPLIIREVTNRLFV